jgi:hypothetical protein
MWTHEKKGMFDPVEIDIVMAMKEKWGMKKTKTQYSTNEQLARKLVGRSVSQVGLFMYKIQKRMKMK